MRRISIILSFFLLIHIPISCELLGITDPCGSTEQLVSTITRLSTSTGSIESGLFSNQISREFEKAAIQISVAGTEYTPVAERHRDFSLLPRVHACSPPPPEPTQVIEAIRITSAAPVYSNQTIYQEGESLNDLFKITDYSYTAEDLSIEEYVELQRNNIWIFGFEGDYIVFQLRSQPDSLIDQGFNFAFEFSDADVITTQAFRFQVDN